MNYTDFVKTAEYYAPAQAGVMIDPTRMAQLERDKNRAVSAKLGLGPNQSVSGLKSALTLNALKKILKRVGIGAGIAGIGSTLAGAASGVPEVIPAGFAIGGGLGLLTAAVSGVHGAIDGSLEDYNPEAVAADLQKAKSNQLGLYDNARLSTILSRMYADS